MTKYSALEKFFTRFGDSVAAHGYTPVSQRIFEKKFGNGLRFVIRLELSGSSLPIATLYYGITVDAVENEINIMGFSNSNSDISRKYCITIFQRWDLVTRLILGKRLPYKIRVSDNVNFDDIELESSISDNEKSFSNLELLSLYCLNDKNLALGHHAFRIPFILAAAGQEKECDSYMIWALSRGVLLEYDAFIEMFEGRRSEWIRRGTLAE